MREHYQREVQTLSGLSKEQKAKNAEVRALFTPPSCSPWDVSLAAAAWVFSRSNGV